MRTTLDIDDDVLDAAKELAAERKTSAGKVISELVRKALVGAPVGSAEIRNGVPMFADHGQVITPEFVKTLDEQSE